MGNPQERPLLSLEFIAGLIVGEGSYCLAIARSRKKDTVEIRPMFSLRMNDVETIDRLQESFKGYGLAIYRSPGIYQRCHTVNVTGIQRMRKHLDVFLPLLTGTKAEAAQVVSDFIDRRLVEAANQGRNEARRYSEEDIASVERLREINGPNARRLDLGILRDYTRRPASNRGPKLGSTPWNKGLVGASKR